MATRRITSTGQLSTRNPGWSWFYYDAVSEAGRQCGLLVPTSMAGLVFKGMPFDSERDLEYNPTLGAEILTVRRGASLEEDPVLPPDPERGWGDPDGITALEPPAPVAAAGMSQPEHGTRGQAHRRQQAEANPQGIPADLLETLDLLGRSYNYLRLKIGAQDPPRSDHARAMAITAVISKTRQTGVGLNDPVFGPDGQGTP